ncbi:hypothetical protein [Chloroflexus sp.]
MEPTPTGIDEKIRTDGTTILTTSSDACDLIGQAGLPDSLL